MIPILRILRLTVHLTAFSTLFGLSLPALIAQQVDVKQTKATSKFKQIKGVNTYRDIEFSKPEGHSLKLDLYLPKEPSSKTLPVIIWVHGGGWVKGSKTNCKISFLAQRGFAVVSTSYRLVDIAQWPSQINDCYETVRWIRNNATQYGFDAQHIGIMGSSAGGHLAALVGTRPYPGKEVTSSRVQAVCDWFGPTELLTMPPNTISKKRTRADVETSNGAKLLGATVMDAPKLANDASALHHVSSSDPPFLIMHGSEDKGVPISQSQSLHKALVKARVPSEFITIQGAAHGGPLFRTPEVYDKVTEFFRRHLK